MPSQPAPVSIALTTISSLEEGRRLARLLVEGRLAACVNLVPNLTSVYRWKGAVEESSEVLLLIKTSAELLGPLEAALRELHPYELPEVLVLGITSGSQPYLDWILGSVVP